MNIRTRRLKAICVAVLSIASATAVAQGSTIETPSRDNYIESFPQYFFVWPALKITSTSFSISEPKNRQHKLSYKPDAIIHAGGGIYVFGIGIQIFFPLAQKDANIERYGKTHAFDLQANILGKNWVLDAFTQHYRGYYLDDSAVPVGSGLPYPQRADIETQNTGITGAWFFNKNKFSIRSTYNYFERQLKSSGSFLLSGNFNTFSLHADSSVYTTAHQPAFGARANFDKVRYTTIALAPGYAFNLVILRRFFVGGALAIGPGVSWFNYRTESVPERSVVQLNTFADVRFSIGYNGERVFSGITLNAQSRNINYEGVRFTSTNEAVKFAIGYRFYRFGILKRNVSDIFKPKGE